MEPVQCPIVSDVFMIESKQQQKNSIRQETLMQAVMWAFMKVLGKGLLGWY